eukprot:TRINITY_DN151_c0_g1_i1.p1 TRINITY_DN151_c0_g1~~TRINITY_DN151_c0_g1_i1.p1  ORF type:complete len:402 (+),score=144.77 TRINITY_DN151_c0_g1_i1:45-1250(+)
MAPVTKSLCLACSDATCDFKPVALDRRAVGPHDVLIEMKYCGVCHSDLHVAAGHMDAVRKTKYDCVPGHELAGVVQAVGEKVTKVKVGDGVGVGCIVDSCRKCEPCKAGEENKCKKQMTGTYNGETKHGRADQPGIGHTIGGYTDKYVCDENYVISIPEGYPMECAGPVFCAGITMYDPLKEHGVKAGMTVGIAGLGGLGQMGVQLAKAMGAKVTVLSRSAGKKAFAEECGADDFIVYTDEAATASKAKTIDLILNTIPSYHDYIGFNKFLNDDGKHVLLGIHKGFAAAMFASKFVEARTKVSVIGGIARTQEVIDLCAEHKIYPKVEVVPVWDIADVYTKLDKNNDSGKRFVLDIAGTLNEEAKDKFTAPLPELSEPPAPLSLWAVVKELSWFLFRGRKM